ncbi:hypothetical protein AG1IA_03867 [Rhizoctonia solani AG-1 IA]|uniref:Uncharacterized protein n=1 Tax=Thanatephorus cucumeris (strain AG1-IA) TaxID=983506 RepID=L8WZ55_THACA|nr:hypothetical protein AG1IA_03867 [Rhizoctonia solani AG-1 IA]
MQKVSEFVYFSLALYRLRDFVFRSRQLYASCSTHRLAYSNTCQDQSAGCLLSVGWI